MWPVGLQALILDLNSIENGKLKLKQEIFSLSDALLPSIFEAFTQEDASSTSRYGGSGLSLAAAKGIVELMGGTISVTSEKNVGSTFAVVIPMPFTAEQPPVEEALEAEIALELFANSPLHYYDAVLMDLRMPLMDGLDAARAIRALPRDDAKTVPIIALTANAAESDVQQTREAGMNMHMAKPASTVDLYATLKRFIYHIPPTEG